MDKKTIILFAASLWMALQVSGQQLPQFSQYMNNPYVLNPAASSLYSDIDIHAGFRQQWAGYDGAPQTYYLSGTVNIGRRQQPSGPLYSIPISYRRPLLDKQSDPVAKHVIGGLAAVDEYGMFQRTSVMGSYAYHLPLGDTYFLAAGISMGWYGLQFASNRVVLENPTDATYDDFIANGTRSDLFDVNAGLYLYGERLFAGYSIYQIGKNEIDLGNESGGANLSEARLAIHHYATAGYRFSLTESLDLTPSAMFKIQTPAPVSVDVNLMAEFDRRFRLGISYRNQDAVAVLAGADLNDWLRLAYSYDYVTSRINDLSSGSHEVVLGVQLNRKNQ